MTRSTIVSNRVCSYLHHPYEVLTSHRLSPTQISRLHRMQDRAIEAATLTDPPPFDRKGIVLVAGGGRCFTNAFVSLTILRSSLKTQLPIQVWHLGPDEMTARMKKMLHRFDVDLVDAFAVRRRSPMRRLSGWECKVFAVRHSPYLHVLLLDADNMALADPEFLFSLPEYQETGAVFWPDNQSHLADSPVWEIFRTAYRPELEVESGQLLIDKKRCWVPLNLALHFNDWSDIYFRYVYGDKETFHFAWRHLDQPYAMPAGRPRILYCFKETPHGCKRMTGALEQSDFDGRPIFHHRTGAEWVLYGENARTSETALEERCLQALGELRLLWDGRIAQDEPRTKLPLGRDLCDTRYIRYRRIGVEEQIVTFEPDGSMHSGLGRLGQTWRMEEDCLTLSDADGDFCRLSDQGGGIWRGTSLWYDRVPIELIPLETSTRFQ
jgi:hypothetical protein